MSTKRVRISPPKSTRNLIPVKSANGKTNLLDVKSIDASFEKHSRLVYLLEHANRAVKLHGDVLDYDGHP